MLIIPNSVTKYKQYNFRMNLTAKVNQYISTTLGVMQSQGRQKFSNRKCRFYLPYVDERSSDRTRKFGQMANLVPTSRTVRIHM